MICTCTFLKIQFPTLLQKKTGYASIPILQNLVMLDLYESLCFHQFLSSLAVFGVFDCGDLSG